MSTLHKQVRLPRFPGPPTLRRLAMEEDGAAYTLSYVMVIPVYALLICLIIDSMLMMTAKLGTVYSAYAAARTASVWSSATTWEMTIEKAKSAGMRSMTPFASGTHGGLLNAVTVDSVGFQTAYLAYAKKPISPKYLANKYGYARSHVTVEIEGPPEHWQSPITAKVTYKFPFAIPGIARLFGKPDIFGNYYFELTSTATVPNEAPQDDRKTIGIGYGTLE